MYPIKTKEKYLPWNLEKTWKIFTTVYLWNYESGNLDENVWSHCWVDIFPQTKNDNIFACLDWIINFAWNKDANGNYIIIEHKNVPDPNNNNQNTTLYSCYLHLSELNVKTWDIVKEWDIIGKSWNTWNVSWSTWEHLHFQIDTKDALFHPYWPFTFMEAKDAWLGFFEAVNKWLGIENAKKFTVNPLVYLDSIKKWFDNFTHSLSDLPSANNSNNNLSYNWIEDSSTLIASTSNINNTTKTVEPTKDTPKQNTYFKDTNEDYINYLYEKWVTKWYSDGTFKPNWEISRAELLAMIFTFSKTPILENVTKSSFKDIKETDWYFKYIETAVNKWFISGYPDNTFKPNNNITKIEAIAIILNIVLWKDKIPNLTGSIFTDIQSWTWYEKYVYYIAQEWLMDISWNKFYPNSNIKRKEVAKILYNLRNIIYT